MFGDLSGDDPSKQPTPNFPVSTAQVEEAKKEKADDFLMDDDVVTPYFSFASMDEKIKFGKNLNAMKT